MHVWYAAYGSNLLEERFLSYLRGGTVPGSERPQHGARDASDPLDARPYRLDRPMGFGFESRRWGGGVCYVDRHTIEPAETLGRAWLITVEQLTDVWAQENGGTEGPPVDLDALVATGTAELGRGAYERLEYLGMLDGTPVATITCDTPPVPNAAGSAYLDVVGRGLIETWSIGPEEAAAYLASRLGNRDLVDRAALAEALAGPR